LAKLGVGKAGWGQGRMQLGFLELTGVLHGGLVAWVWLGSTGKLLVIPSNPEGDLVEGVMAGQSGVGVGVEEPTRVLWGQGALGESGGAGAGGQEAGSVLADGGNAAVNNVASSRGAWLEVKARGKQGLGRGWFVSARSL